MTDLFRISLDRLAKADNIRRKIIAGDRRNHDHAHALPGRAGRQRRPCLAAGVQMTVGIDLIQTTDKASRTSVMLLGQLLTAPLTLMTSTNAAITISHKTNESPRSHFSNAMMNIAPRATLAMMVAGKALSFANPSLRSATFPCCG